LRRKEHKGSRKKLVTEEVNQTGLPGPMKQELEKIEKKMEVKFKMYCKMKCK